MNGFNADLLGLHLLLHTFVTFASYLILAGGTGLLPHFATLRVGGLAAILGGHLATHALPEFWACLGLALGGGFLAGFATLGITCLAAIRILQHLFPHAGATILAGFVLAGFHGFLMGLLEGIAAGLTSFRIGGLLAIAHLLVTTMMLVLPFFLGRCRCSALGRVGLSGCRAGWLGVGVKAKEGSREQ